jgi:hypothetical protein
MNIAVKNFIESGKQKVDTQAKTPNKVVKPKKTKIERAVSTMAQGL